MRTHGNGPAFSAHEVTKIYRMGEVEVRALRGAGATASSKGSGSSRARADQGTPTALEEKEVDEPA